MIEVGLGGRLDATNVVVPSACAVTSLSLDHVDVLGASLPQIAAEKAAIIKSGAPVVSAQQPPEALDVVERAAERAGVPLLLVGRDITWERWPTGGGAQRVEVATPSRCHALDVPLGGRHQAENAAVAVGVCEALAEAGLGLTPEAIQEGIAKVRWPARMEMLPGEPPTVIDGAHNPYSMRCFREALRERFPESDVVLVFGANRSKDLDGMVAEVRAVGPARRRGAVAASQIVPGACYSGGVLPVRSGSRGGEWRRRRDGRGPSARPPRRRNRGDGLAVRCRGGPGARAGDQPRGLYDGEALTLTLSLRS